MILSKKICSLAIGTALVSGGAGAYFYLNKNSAPVRTGKLTDKFMNKFGLDENKVEKLRKFWNYDQGKGESFFDFSK